MSVGNFRILSVAYGLERIYSLLQLIQKPVKFNKNTIFYFRLLKSVFIGQVGNSLTKPSQNMGIELKPNTFLKANSPGVTPLRIIFLFSAMKFKFSIDIYFVMQSLQYFLFSFQYEYHNIKQSQIFHGYHMTYTFTLISVAHKQVCYNKITIEFFETSNVFGTPFKSSIERAEIDFLQFFWK